MTVGYISIDLPCPNCAETLTAVPTKTDLNGVSNGSMFYTNAYCGCRERPFDVKLKQLKPYTYELVSVANGNLSPVDLKAEPPFVFPDDLDLINPTPQKPTQQKLF